MSKFAGYNEWGFTKKSAGYWITESAPIDKRYVVDTYANISSVISSSCRYPGLRVYVIADDKEYWYKLPESAGANEEVEPENLILVPYHPEAANVVTSASAISQIPTTILETGSEVTLIVNGEATKYIWDKNKPDTVGGGWIALSGSGGSGGGGDIITENHYSIPILSFTTSNAASINALTSNKITTAYQTAMNTSASPNAGTVVSVVFTDNTVSPAIQSSREYVYINDSWKITRGTQEYELTIPSNGDPTCSPNTGVTLDSSSGEVSVIIEHQFDAQFIDSFVFQKKADTDIDNDSTPDPNGEFVLSGATCFKSNGVNKIKFNFVAPSSGTDTYIITLQK